MAQTGPSSLALVAGWHYRSGTGRSRSLPAASPPHRMRHAPSPSPAARRAIAALVAAAALAAARPAGAQVIEDGLMLPKRMVRTTLDYGVESWDRYWEGTNERTNGNIGTLTTRSTMWMGSYGLTDRVTLFATLPYVSTSADAGVLHGMSGAQDVTVAAKYRFLSHRLDERRDLGLSVTAAAGMPTSDYVVDFLPMSIGLGARRAMLRTAMHLKDRRGPFIDASMGRTWRSTVKLDRPAYYTDGQLVLSNEVAMPDVFDWQAGVGFQNATWCIPLMVVQQRTLGGGDIRRQDMPFVSNRMDFTKVMGKVMYTIPQLPALGVSVGGATTLSGRNVGKSTMYSVGLISAFHL